MKRTSTMARSTMAPSNVAPSTMAPIAVAAPSSSFDVGKPIEFTALQLKLLEFRDLEGFRVKISFFEIQVVD